MSEWTDEEREGIARADELQVASRRRDGTLRAPVTIWVVRVGNDLYVRSVRGTKGAWFRGTQTRHEGRIQSGRIARTVAFEEAPRTVNDEIDGAYRAKYRRYAANIVKSVLTAEARAATLRLVPRDDARSPRARSARGRR
jgi:hypothetical protein